VKSRFLRWALTGLCSYALAMSAAHAVSVEYTLTDLGSDVWRYDFALINSPAAPSFDEFTIYFPSDKYSSIALVSSAPDWDPLVIQPDPGIPADGYFDGLSTTGPMPDDSVATGFVLTFSFLAGMRPDGQRFDLIDSSTFDIVYSGTTVAAAVPEPQTYLMLAFGLGLIRALQARRSSSIGRSKLG